MKLVPQTEDSKAYDKNMMGRSMPVHNSHFSNSSHR